MTTEQETGNKKQKWSYPERWWFLPGWEVVTKTLELGLRIKTGFKSTNYRLAANLLKSVYSLAVTFVSADVCAVELLISGAARYGARQKNVIKLVTVQNLQRTVCYQKQLVCCDAVI